MGLLDLEKIRNNADFGIPENPGNILQLVATLKEYQKSLEVVKDVLAPEDGFAMLVNYINWTLRFDPTTETKPKSEWMK